MAMSYSIVFGWEQCEVDTASFWEVTKKQWIDEAMGEWIGMKVRHSVIGLKESHITISRCIWCLSLSIQWCPKNVCFFDER